MCMGGSSKPQNNYYNGEKRNYQGGYGSASVDTDSDGTAESTKLFDDSMKVVKSSKLDKKKKRLSDGMGYSASDLQIPT